MAPNVIIFGETGGGKSSVINLLADASITGTSSGETGCTFKSDPYDVSIGGTTFKFHDTAGLDEGQGRTFDKPKVIFQLYELLRKLDDGVSLLIFCMRGPRIKDSCVRNWQLVWDIICQKRVPILLAVTGMENEDDMDAWWGKNETFFTNNLMYPNRVACITTKRGKKRRDGSHYFDDEYAESQVKMIKAIQTVYRREAWKVARTEWFKTIVETSYESGEWDVEVIKNRKKVFGSVTDEFVLMKREEGEVLRNFLARLTSNAS